MKSSTVFTILVIAGALAAPWTGASAHPSDASPMPPSATVAGEATLFAEPDVAEIDIGVTTQAKTAVAAAEENAGKLSKVVAEIKKLLRPGDELKTAGYSLTPDYRRPREGGKPDIVGYTATNIVRVKIEAPDSAGRLIDTAMRSGANRIHRLSFTLKDEQSAQEQALHQAVVRAKSKAGEIARALGLKIVKVLSVTEVNRSVRPMIQETMAMRASSADTPVEPGTIEVHATVTLTAELGN